MPLPSLALPTQTTNAILSNPLVLTGAVLSLDLFPNMAALISVVSPVPALSAVAPSVIA
jgi:hypothetical protein